MAESERYTILVVGGREAREADIPALERLGQALASSGVDILTGACDGNPQVVAQAARKAGARVSAHSPWEDADAHGRSADPGLENFDAVSFVGEVADEKQRFGLHARELVTSCDAAIVMNGGNGTKDEVAILRDWQIVTAFFTAVTGTEKMYRELADPDNTHDGVWVMADRDPAGLVSALLYCLKQLTDR